MEEEGVVLNAMALIACIAMALFYVAILYAPTVLLRLPPPSSFETYMIRRFLCAIVSTILSLFLSVLILPVWMSLTPLFWLWLQFFTCSFSSCH